MYHVRMVSNIWKNHAGKNYENSRLVATFTVRKDVTPRGRKETRRRIRELTGCSDKSKKLLEGFFNIGESPAEITADRKIFDNLGVRIVIENDPASITAYRYGLDAVERYLLGASYPKKS